uniref:Membrane-bound transcription factor site-2 protease n=1 Tax=Rhabditophanes sp. KR3021 TaxID=114890 RepID=A0AC35TFM7_9BILA
MSTNHDSVRTYPLVFGDGVEEEMRTVKSYDDVDNAIMYAVSKHREPAQSGITPIIPGVNLPLNQIPLFIFVLIVCGIFHELGHAIAAVYSNVKVNGFGFFMVVVYPGAFTDIDSEQLERANAFTKLWIFCAGIWHNLILATLFALIFFSTPVISAPFYSDSNGILVTEVFEESGLFGGAGLEAGNIIVSINGCKVTNISSYFNCLNLIEKDIYPNGYLIEKEVVYQQTATQVQKIDNEVRCCDEFSNTTLASHLCFMYNKEKPGNGSSSRSPFGKIVNVDPAKEIINKFSCFPAKQVTDLTRCHYDTRNSNTLESLECVKPALFNGTFLIRIELAANLKPVLFIGKLDELRYMIDAYHLTPRLSILPNWPPMFLELVCKYFITFSLALAFVNAVPCFSFDGQFILRTVVEFYFGGKKRRFVCDVYR